MARDQAQQQIDLQSPLAMRTAFRFPIQNPAARREVIIGAALLLIPLVGWLLNMGHRIQLVHNMQSGSATWPAWKRPGHLLKFGAVTFLGMVEYYVPAAALAYCAWRWQSRVLGAISVLLWILATIAIPGYMSHYCKSFDAREVFDPFKALGRVIQGGTAYWHAWGLTLAALALSFLGLLGLGVGFLVTSVWFWQVAGFSFASVFSTKFGLVE